MWNIKDRRPWKVCMCEEREKTNKVQQLDFYY